MGLWSIPYVGLFIVSVCVATEPIHLRRDSPSNSSNPNPTTTITKLTTIFETTVTPISTSRDSSCGGITVHAVNVNAYYWDSIHRITKTNVERDDVCTSDPNTIVGKPTPVPPNSTDPRSPATIPIYLSYVAVVTGESTYTNTVTDLPLTLRNVTYAETTETYARTIYAYSTISPDPTDMVVTAKIVGSGTLYALGTFSSQNFLR